MTQYALLQLSIGVSFDDANLTRPWRAQITIGGQKRHLGYFGTETEAARAYDSAAVEHHRGRAVLNFDDVMRAPGADVGDDDDDSLSSNSFDSEDERLEKRLRSVLRNPTESRPSFSVDSGLSSDEDAMVKGKGRRNAS